MIKSKNWAYFLWNFNTYVSIYMAFNGIIILGGPEWFWKNLFLKNNNTEIDSYLTTTIGILSLIFSLLSLEMSYATRLEMLRCNAMGNCIIWTVLFYYNLYFFSYYSILFKCINFSVNSCFLTSSYIILCTMKFEEERRIHS